MLVWQLQIQTKQYQQLTTMDSPCLKGSTQLLYIICVICMVQIGVAQCLNRVPLASSPGHSQLFNIFQHATLKSWEWPGDEARVPSPRFDNNVTFMITSAVCFCCAAMQ